MDTCTCSSDLKSFWKPSVMRAESCTRKLCSEVVLEDEQPPSGASVCVCVCVYVCVCLFCFQDLKQWMQFDKDAHHVGSFIQMLSTGRQTELVRQPGLGRFANELCPADTRLCECLSFCCRCFQHVILKGSQAFIGCLLRCCKA